MAVPRPFPGPYSPNSTDASWKAAKTDGIRDKWNTELGAALRAAKLAYDKIHFEQLDVGLHKQKHGKWTVAADVDVAKIAARQHYELVVKPAIKALAAAKSKADWAGRNLVISKAANVKARQIAADLGTRLDKLKHITFNDYDAEKARILENYQYAFDTFASGMTRVLGNADKFVRRVRKTPTPATFNTGIVAASRDITQQLGNVEGLRKNGLDVGKPDPTRLSAVLEEWGAGRDKLPATASRVKVLKAISDYEGYVDDIKAWWR